MLFYAGVELQATTLSVHSSWSLGLHPYNDIPSCERSAVSERY